MNTFESAELLYENDKGQVLKKKIRIPQKRFNIGISKQREGYVNIGYFPLPLNTKKQGYTGLHGQYKEIHVTLPKSAVMGTARLKIGKRIVSRAK